MPTKRLLIASIGLLACVLAKVQAEDVGPSPGLARLPFTLTTVESPAERISGELVFASGCANSRVDQTLSFVDVREVRAFSFDRRVPVVKISFEVLGGGNWLVCTELRALDAEGKLLHHTWATSGGSSEQEPKHHPSSGTFSVSLQRIGGISADLSIPGEVARHLARLDIRFHNLSGDKQRHFPRRNHKYDPRLSAPKEDGSFDISFANPNGQENGSDDLVAFELLVYDEDGTLVRTDFRVVEPLPPGARYRFSVRVEPEYFEHSIAGIGFFHRPRCNKETLRASLSESSGVTRSGTSDGGKLIELPLEGREYFSELPTRSGAAR